MARIDDLVRFYELLGTLESRLGGKRSLKDCSGRLGWPVRGVYFFYEPGEERSDSGHGLRVVRVGTHALNYGSNTTLWNRLSQHKGQSKSGGGNHRGSIFRLLVGTALIARGGLTCPTWSQGSSAPRDIRDAEQPVEKFVSAQIGDMPFLWIAVEDDPGPASLRGYIERNSIALLSNFKRTPADPSSKNWLGRYCQRQRVQASGLWNQNHTDEDYEPKFLDALAALVAAMRG